MMTVADATTDLRVVRARVRQRLQASGGAGQGAGHDGPAQRWPRGDRARRRLDDHRLRADSGMPYDSPGVRIDRFVEGLQIIKKSMQPEPFSFEGKHYTITDYDGTAQAGAGRGTGARRRRRQARARHRGTRSRHRRHQRQRSPRGRRRRDVRHMTAEAVDKKVDHRERRGRRSPRRHRAQHPRFLVNVTDDRQAVARTVAGLGGGRVARRASRRSRSSVRRRSWSTTRWNAASAGASPT